MMKLMEALEYVREYIDNRLVITRGTLQDHLITKGGYQEATPNGIVQAILALNPPHNVKELRHFLSMVQYYRDM